MLDCGLFKRTETLHQTRPEIFTAAALGKLEYLRGNHDFAITHLEKALASTNGAERQRATKLLSRLSPSTLLTWSKHTARTRLHQNLSIATQPSGFNSAKILQPLGDEHLLNSNRVADIVEKMQCLNAYLKEMGLCPVQQCASTSSFDIHTLSPPISKNRRPSEDAVAVSVIMTVYNGAQYLRASILSILNQVGVRTELIVVDDASIDETWNVICRLSKEFPNRIVAKRLERNVGTYAAKNIALGMCKTDYVAFQDADDWSHPQRLGRSIAWLEANKKNIASTSRYVRIDQSGRFFSPNVWPLRQWSPNTLVLRRLPVLQAIGTFDQVRFGADTDFFERIRVHFGDRRLIFHSEVTLIAMGLPSSLMHNQETGLDPLGHSWKRVLYRNERAERLLSIAISAGHDASCTPI